MASDAGLHERIDDRAVAHRPVHRRGVGREGGRPALTLGQVGEWADAYREAEGRWPGARSGPVPGGAGVTWNAIDTALRKGARGLPGGSSLARMLADRSRAERLRAWEQEQFPTRGPRLRLPMRGRRPPLFIAQILAWANAHRDATGAWPRSKSGRVRDSPFDDTWGAIRLALMKGARGLPGARRWPGCWPSAATSGTSTA